MSTASPTEPGPPEPPRSEGMMATASPTEAGLPEPPRSESSGRPPLIVVDFGKRQSRKSVKRLRKGRGKLMPRVEQIVDEMIQAGTLKADTRALVIVVRERYSALLGRMMMT